MKFTMYGRSGSGRCGGSVSGLVMALFLGLAPGLGAQEASTETVSDVLARAKGAHAADPAKAPDGGPLPPPEELTSVARGTIGLFTAGGLKAAFDVTFVREGYTKMQAIVHQPGIDVRLGTDGESSWHSLSNGMRADAAAAATARRRPQSA